MTTEQKELHCPNCQAPAIPKDGQTKIVCAGCGGTFEFIAGEAKLRGVGELDRLREDVEELKQRLPASTPAAVPPAGDDEDPGEGEDEDEDDL